MFYSIFKESFSLKRKVDINVTKAYFVWYGNSKTWLPNIVKKLHREKLNSGAHILTC